MIIYDSKKWNSLAETILKTFSESYNQRLLAKFVVLVSIYASVITYINLHWFNHKLTIDSMYFSMLGFVLSLFLVFRLNSAYDRWWEGRKAWGKLINDSRTLALLLNAHIPAENRALRKFFVVNISNFAIALTWHLRFNNPKAIENMIFVNARTTKELQAVNHIPNAVASSMYEKVTEMAKNGEMTEFDKVQIREVMQGLIDVLGVCERIKKTPIPFSHSTFIKLFILIYVFVLPFGLVPVFEYLTIPAVVVMTYAMMGIELISEEIEDPFGEEANSLPTSAMSDTIRDSAYEILHVKAKFDHEKVSATGILH